MHLCFFMSHCCNSKSHLTSNCICLYPLYVLQGAPCASYQLAVSIIQNCAEKLEPFICGFLTNCILDRDAVENELKEFYHEIIFQIFQCAPQMLLAVIPNLTHELLVWILCVCLLGLFSVLFSWWIYQCFYTY